jgi:hypothetical protein
VGPRQDPFNFDLEQFLKIIPDRDYKAQPNPGPPSAKCFQTGFIVTSVMNEEQMHPDDIAVLTISFH